MFFCWLRGSPEEEDAKVFSEQVKVMAFPKNHNSSCHKVKSSRSSARRFPVGPDDLTLRHEELCDCREHYKNHFHSFARLSWAGVAQGIFSDGSQILGSKKARFGALSGSNSRKKVANILSLDCAQNRNQTW